MCCTYFHTLVKKCFDNGDALKTNINNDSDAFNTRDLTLPFEQQHFPGGSSLNFAIFTNLVHTLKNNSWMQAIINFRIILINNTFMFFNLNQPNQLHWLVNHHLRVLNVEQHITTLFVFEQFLFDLVRFVLRVWCCYAVLRDRHYDGCILLIKL